MYSVKETSDCPTVIELHFTFLTELTDAYQYYLLFGDVCMKVTSYCGTDHLVCADCSHICLLDVRIFC